MKKDLLIILLLIIPSFSQLIQPGFFPMHDDLQTIRHLQMSKCISDGQIPCRWVPDLGNGYGYPLFNYYPPLPYYIGQIFVGLNFSYIDTVKSVAVLGFILSAIFMYFLGREVFSRKVGITAALFYTYAPYHSVDMYVRGAFNEFYALVFFPLILLSIFKVIQRDKFSIWVFILAISISGLMLSHNPMLMIFVPVAVLWTIFWIIKTKNISSLLKLFISGLFALGISSFFTLPVLFEQKYVHVETLVIGYFNYLAHFSNLNQIFLNINWGYGGSGLGDGDGMSFAIGHLHWIAPVFVFILSLVRKDKKLIPIIILLTLLSFGSLFMTHSKSSFIWAMFKPLEYLQFPWRFLTISILCISLLASLISKVVPHKINILITTAIILLNSQYFVPLEWRSDIRDENVFSGMSWKHLISGSIFDYLPKSAPLPPPNPAESLVEFVEGGGIVKSEIKKTNLQEIEIQTTSPYSTIRFNTFYFPGWSYYINEKLVSDYNIDPVLGVPIFKLSESNVKFKAVFSDTPLRRLSNLVSVLSIGVFGISLTYYLLKKR